MATLEAKPVPGKAETTSSGQAIAAEQGGSGVEEELAGAERVLERDR